MERKELTAHSMACDFIVNPIEPKYIDESIRQFQGCPTIAITKGGRIYVGWYSGGTIEPHMDNFNLLVYSDDKGKTWSKPILVIPSDHNRWVHALDIQLWTAPDGRLFVFWVQDNTEPVELGRKGYVIDGFVFYDKIHAEWVSICDNPDAENPVFSEPRYLDKGFLRCKPLALENGTWINFNYDQTTDRYGYSISADNGNTYKHYYGAKKIETPFDECMAYQKKDGSIRMFARTSVGEIAESTSFDNGINWSETKKSGILNPDTRFYVGRTPTGRIILINNDHNKDRCNMTIYLSDDDGETWRWKKCIDKRPGISYPDVDFYDSKVYLTYDHGRCGDNEILFAVFTEDDIINNNPIELKIISKP